jgi:hypothetical protein
METLENRLQKRIHASLYALLFLTALLGISVLLEGCAEKRHIAQNCIRLESDYATTKEFSPTRDAKRSAGVMQTTTAENNRAER